MHFLIFFNPKIILQLSSLIYAHLLYANNLISIVYHIFIFNFCCINLLCN